MMGGIGRQQSAMSRQLHHTTARRQAPEVQNKAMATPRAIAVTERANQIPSNPIVADHHAASGSRRSVSPVLTVCGQHVYSAPASAPSRVISNVWPISANAITRRQRLPSAITAGTVVDSPTTVRRLAEDA